MGNNRGVLIRKDKVEQSQPNRRRMNLRMPFPLIKNALSDLQLMNDFNYIIPHKMREDFWEEECDKHSSKSTCIIYEV